MNEAAVSAPARAVQPWNEDVLRTRLFDAISLMLPAGEAFVIDAVAQGAARLRGDDAPTQALREEAGRFVREEQAHQRAHRVYNDRLAHECRPARALEQGIESAVRGIASLDLRTRLALAAAFEQLTALLSAEMLRGNVWITDKPCKQASLWRWHCAEEVAHHHVAVRMSKACGVGPLRRVGCFMLASCFLLVDVGRTVIALCRHDVATSSASRLSLAGQALRFAWRAAPGLCRVAGGWLARLVFREAFVSLSPRAG